MVNRNIKDNCLPLVGLHYCSYYSTCCIARQFGDRQGAPSDDGSFHTLAFTDRILGRIHESWPRQRLTKGICFPQFLHPTSGYKKWLEVDMKWVLIDEKATRGQTKERGLTDYLDMPQILLSALYNSQVFSFDFNKGLECSKSSMETIYYLLI